MGCISMCVVPPADGKLRSPCLDSSFPWHHQVDVDVFWKRDFTAKLSFAAKLSLAVRLTVLST